jgi:hypothetical protein
MVKERKSDMYFLEDIYHKRSFKRDKIFRKHIEEWRRIAPDFSTLNDIAETIKELELVFMYDNSNSSSIYARPKAKAPGTNSFVVDDDDMNIVITLYADDEVIDIALNRKKGNRISTNMRFKNHEGDEYIKSSKDMMIFALIEDRIMTTFCNLLEFYYYNGPHRSIDSSLLPSMEE